MLERLQQTIEAQFGITQEDLTQYATQFFIGVAALIFVLVSTVIVAFDSIFLLTSPSSLSIGEVAGRTFVAPPTGGAYVSEVLTERAREEARANVQPIFSSPSIATVRTWDQRAEQTLNYLNDVRAAGRYDIQEQQLSDLEKMDYLIFSVPENAVLSLTLDEDSWNTVIDEVNNVIDLAYRDSIINAEEYINTRLAFQINSTLADRINALVFDIVDDFIKPNTFENIPETEAARDAAASAVQAVERTFVGGQIIIGANEPIDDIAFEALQAFNLLTPQETTLQNVLRAFVASTVTLVIFGFYIARFSPHLLYSQVRRLSIIAITFLIMLAATNFLGVNGNIYLFPVAAMALLYVAIADTHVAVIGSIGLAFLVGLIASDSLEHTVLIAASSLIGALGLREAGRLNQFFVAGALITVVDVAVIILFAPSTNGILSGELLTTFAFTIFSGLLLTPATAIAAMFVLTSVFNLTTVLKLIDLQQPNKPLLQRLLREVPGTYQHSLQVGNLAEQAANAIGADAQLTHVAALYHDIGKMHNPLYFTENQQDLDGNPHDTLNDPYRSADIIIGHVTEGDDMARQAGLPQRIRDFIREHHGTTQVFVFYQRALNAVDGDKAAVDIGDFTYPGPKPRSKETAILMLADSCEAAVRSAKLESKQEIREFVAKIINGKRDGGQLDDSGLTLNDIRTINEIFVDILFGMFHPRINYQEAAKGVQKPATSTPAPKPPSEPPMSQPDVAVPTPARNGVSAPAAVEPEKPDASQTSSTQDVEATPNKALASSTTTNPIIEDDTIIEDDEPLPEVPRLPTLDERRATASMKSTEPPATAKDDDSETDDSGETSDS